MRKRVEELFREIAAQYESEIDAMGVMSDHVHIFPSASPRYSPAKVVEVLKSISSKVVFEEFPWLEQNLWGESFGVMGIL